MQYKVLFISSDKDLLDYANLYLNNNNQDFIFLKASSVSEAVNILDRKDHLDLIYLGHQINKDIALSDLSNKLLSIINLGETKLFGTNKAFQNKDWATYFHEFTLPNKILLTIYDSFEINALEDDSYLPFPLISILSFANFPFDCFIDVKKKGNLSYIKIFNEGDEILYQDVDKYRERGLSNIYMNKKEVNAKIIQYEKKLKEKEVGVIENLENFQTEAIEFSADLLDEIGIEIRPVHKNLTKEAFKNTQTLIKTTETQKKLFAQLVNKNDLYYYKHITLTSLLCCYILDELLLTDRKLKEKLCLASNLQNIILDDEAELKLYSKDQLGHFDMKTQQKILTHPDMAANILSKNERVDLDVLKIIREHHGDKLGKSMPDCISSTSKLSLIFQLSSQFAQRYLIAQDIYGGKNIDVFKIFSDIYQRLESKDKSLVKALKQVIQNLSYDQ